MISVITPTWNRQVLLAETMDSVLAQGLGRWEHIIVDDGSDDGTPEMVAARAQADSRVIYAPHPRGRSGACACRNHGARIARASLLVFLDSDDLLAPGALGARVELMQRNLDLDFSVFQTGVFEKVPGDLGKQMSPDLVGDDLIRFLLMETPWQTTAPTWRRSAFERIGGFDEALPSWQDVELHVRAICAGLFYLRLPQVDHFMRWQFEPTKVSIEQRRSPAHLKAALSTLEKIEGLVRFGPGLDWSRLRALCRTYYFVAEQWLAQGNTSEALNAWRKVRERGLGSPALYGWGAMMLRLQSAAPSLGGRLAHKWQGWVRMRTNAELVDNGRA